MAFGGADGFYRLLPHCVVVVFEERSQQFVQKLLVLLVVESFEEVGDVLGDCQLESPLFVIQAPLNQR